MDTQRAFKALDQELKKRDLDREIVICGGAALIALGILSRQTRDVDVIDPKLDRDLLESADAIASSLSLRKGWLNNGPEALSKELASGWGSRCVEVFQGTHLTVKSIGRQDLIFSKFYAACDRIDDLDDLVQLKPTAQELEKAKILVLEMDGAEIWPKIVAAALEELHKRIKNGKS